MFRSGPARGRSSVVLRHQPIVSGSSSPPNTQSSAGAKLNRLTAKALLSHQEPRESSQRPPGSCLQIFTSAFSNPEPLQAKSIGCSSTHTQTTHCFLIFFGGGVSAADTVDHTGRGSARVCAVAIKRGPEMMELFLAPHTEE